MSIYKIFSFNYNNIKAWEKEEIQTLIYQTLLLRLLPLLRSRGVATMLSSVVQLRAADLSTNFIAGVEDLKFKNYQNLLEGISNNLAKAIKLAHYFKSIVMKCQIK